jgi:histidinol phosphatase-like PHP family hydrolase
MAQILNNIAILKQDLHIHTIYSTADKSIVPEQTIEMIAQVKHAQVVGISDHFECLYPSVIEQYSNEIRSFGLKLGTEVNGHLWVEKALEHNFDYYIYHCYNTDNDYQGAKKLLSGNKPVIIAHPYFLETDLAKVPEGCLIEINNRYVWRNDWKSGYYTQHKNKFKFVAGSDAHQPNWLSQTMAQYVMRQLEIEETILF